MDKKKVLLFTIQFAAAFSLVHWLVGINIWLDLFLAGAMAKGSYTSITVIELRGALENQKLLFSIADNELVRVSALTTSLEERICDLEEKVSKAEDLLQDHDSVLNNRR